MHDFTVIRLLSLYKRYYYMRALCGRDHLIYHILRSTTNTQQKRIFVFVMYKHAHLYIPASISLGAVRSLKNIDQIQYKCLQFTLHSCLNYIPIKGRLVCLVLRFLDYIKTSNLFGCVQEKMRLVLLETVKQHLPRTVQNRRTRPKTSSMWLH